ncbi:uncharacterized protein LOC122392160 isoform X1 [Amphibalanus amphitrite]|uniref:uncharacterized protein LOC122392160 isoform X1 n=1 Tax=Amphibalanus amphitrite TaxID=1232801 RepID=UPI001C919D7C|nr:uncharacterized protein LOC122392160 isoform X1 [Amphibalanus amphitrite]
MSQKEQFYKLVHETKISSNSALITDEKYEIIKEELQGISKGAKPSGTAKRYRIWQKYRLVKFGSIEKVVDKKSAKEIVRESDLFDVINELHSLAGHCGRDKTLMEVQKHYASVSRKVVWAFLSTCQTCEQKKPRPGQKVVTKPILSNDMNSRAQVDLIDWTSESSKGFRYILTYQDHLTKFVVLRPLKSKRAEEVVFHLIDIFCLFGAPNILQSDNGREFRNKVIKQCTAMWPSLQLVRGRPRHSQSQGSVERANRLVQEKLRCWLADNPESNWPEGLRFVQWMINTQKNDGIGTAPYKAMFGVEPHMGLRDTQLRGAPARLLRTEQELADMLGLVADGSRQTATDAGLDSQSGSSSSSDWQPAGRAHAGRRRSGRAVVCSSSSSSSSSDEEPASCTPGRSGPTVAVAGSSSSDEEPASCTPGRSGPTVAVAGSSSSDEEPASCTPGRSGPTVAVAGSSSSDEEPASCTPGRSGPTVAVAGSSSSDEEPASCTPGRSGPTVAVAGSSSSDEEPASCTPGRSGPTVAVAGSSSSDEEPASCTPGRSGPTVAVAGSSSSDEEPASCTPGRSGPTVAVAGSNKGMQQSPVAAQPVKRTLRSRRCTHCYGPAPASDGFCDLCSRAKRALEEREIASASQKKQANLMLARTRKAKKILSVGQNVRIGIPDVDRARTQQKNVIGVILECVGESQYIIGTTKGKLSGVYGPEAVQPCAGHFISSSDVPDISITLRECARLVSGGKGQGMFSCKCRRGVCKGRCKCIKAGVTCISRCHKGAHCNNK